MKVGVRRIYDPPDSSEEFRILVDRVWPRGISRDKVDFWLKDIAPSAALRKWYGHEPERWPVFRAKYLKELERNPDAVTKLRKLIRGRSVILMYGARDRERNQAVVLRDFLKTKR